MRNQAQLQSFIANEAAQGQYLTQAQFDATYAPTMQQVQAVEDWATARSLRIVGISPSGLSILARGTTAQVEAALHVQINDYRSVSGSVFYSADRDPTVPESLGLQTVLGLDNFYHLQAEIAPHAVPQNGFTPANFRAAYDLSGHVNSGTGQNYDRSGQTIGIILSGAPVQDSDLSAFATNTVDRAICANTTGSSPYANCVGADQVTWTPVDGTSTDTSGWDEAAMDLEYAHGMALHSSVKFWLSSDGTTATLVDAISSAASDPAVHIVSNSWGIPGIASATDPFVVASSNSFEQAAAVGTTFYFASGDQASNSGCMSSAPTCGLPLYPADSPYVVAVGGTNLQADLSYNVWQSEQAWATSATDGSGSGCATYFARPSWQLGVSVASCSGRAEPDIAADGDGGNSPAYVYEGGAAHEFGGTSLATPITAGLAAVTDSYLAANGKPLMGWAAPRIYQLANSPYYNSYFHDVVCGNNGFTAGPGWDQVTGWGSQDWYQYALGWAGQAVSATPASVSGMCHESSNVLGNLLSVGCTSPTTCYAVGNSATILHTTDGWTWRAETAPAAVTSSLNSITCPASGTCFAVSSGGDVITTTDGGSTWSALTNTPSGTAALFGIACLSTTTCNAVGEAFGASGTIFHTGDGGQTWSTLGPANAIFYGVACPGANTCYAVGSNSIVMKSTDGGQTWSSDGTSVGNVNFGGIVCPSPTTCYAVGGAQGNFFNTVGAAVYKTTDGTNWTLESTPADGNGYGLNGVSCVTANVCTAVGGYVQTNTTQLSDVIVSSDGGAHWTSVNTRANELNGVACVTHSTCFTVGDSNAGAIDAQYVQGDIETINSATTAAVPIAKGWNLVDVPYESSATDSALIANMDTNGLGTTAVKALATYGNGAFGLYVPGYSADETLSSTQGIFALSGATGSWNASGFAYQQGQPVGLTPGWNLVAMPYPASGLTASQIADEIDSSCATATAASPCGVGEIAAYTNGMYNTWTPPQGSVTAFSVAPTSGIWVEMSSASNWTPT